MLDYGNSTIIFCYAIIKKIPSVETERISLVGVAGFEPAASCSQSRRDNRATLHPESGCKYRTIFCLCKTIFEIRNNLF
jgi:hypothetical protein